MKVYVYVEGRSDVLAMQTLFADLIATKREQGISIDFIPADRGDAKYNLLVKTPKRRGIIYYMKSMFMS